jgi:iodothyronine deiodinase-like protein
LDALHELYDRFGRDVAFFIVYIKEAHPEDGWVVTHNREEDIGVLDPQSAAERADVATTCLVKSSIRIPMLVDGPDNRVASAYGGWPDRLYLIGRDGRVAFQGDAGPFGFIPDRLEEAIQQELKIGEHS